MIGTVTATTIRSLTVKLNAGVFAQQILPRDQVGKVAIGRAAPQQADVHQHERHADGRDQRRQLRRAAQRLVDDPVDRHVQRRAEQRHDDQQQTRCPATAWSGSAQFQPRLSAIAPIKRQRQKRAEHEHVAVGEIDQLDDPVDHRVAQGDQREQRAVGQADQGILQKTSATGPTRRPAAKSTGNIKRSCPPSSDRRPVARPRARADYWPSSLTNLNCPSWMMLPLIVLSVVSPLASNDQVPSAPCRNP